ISTASYAFGIWKTIATAVTRQQQAAVRSAPASRPGRGASSSASSAPSGLHGLAMALAPATASHQDVGRLPQPRRALRDVIEADANRKALGDHHPAEGAPDLRQARRPLVRRGHTPPEALHVPPQRPVPRAEQPDGGRVPDLDARQLGLAEVPDRVPL